MSNSDTDTDTDTDTDPATPCACIRLTPTERRLLKHLDRFGTRNCTKEQLAVLLGRNRKTIDRLIAHLKKMGLVVVTPRFDETGAQVANGYRVTEQGHERAELLNATATKGRAAR